MSVVTTGVLGLSLPSCALFIVSSRLPSTFVSSPSLPPAQYRQSARGTQSSSVRPPHTPRLLLHR